MKKKAYYWLWLRIAFRHSIGLGDGVGFLIGIVAPVIRQFIPNWDSAMNELAWQIPLGVFGSIVMVRLLLSPYWIHKDGKKECNELLALLEAKPSLWIRAEGLTLLTDIKKELFPRKIAWYFNVSIANCSPTQHLGIRSIILRLEYNNIIKNIRPYLGTPLSDYHNAPTGDIGVDKYLKPSEPYSGELVFIEDYIGTELQLKDKIVPWDTATIILIDSQDSEHPFPVEVKNITWR